MNSPVRKIMGGKTIIELSGAEHRLVIDAKKIYGDYYDNAEGFIYLICNFINSAEESLYVFSSYLSQVSKFALLSFLSAFRFHYGQAWWCLRSMQESGVIAAYALEKPEIIEGLKKDEQGKIVEDNKIFEKARKWLENDFEEHNEAILAAKNKVINSGWTHSTSLIQTSLNIRITDEMLYCMFFDTLGEQESDYNSVRTILFTIANQLRIFIDLYANIISKNKMARLSDNFGEQYIQLRNKNEELRKRGQETVSNIQDS